MEKMMPKNEELMIYTIFLSIYGFVVMDGIKDYERAEKMYYK